jgi:hypothetical protein
MIAMLRERHLLMLLMLLCGSMMASAQTDYTGLIKNPSFEQNTEGWEQEGMSVQGNNVFSIKSGTNYMERWTGRGSAVGNGKLVQELRNLPPGNYELSAAAQNIQEDTPNKEQIGAWIFAETSKLTTLPSSLNKTDGIYIINGKKVMVRGNENIQNK